MEETIKLQGKDRFNYRAEKMNERNKSHIYFNVITIQTSGIENSMRLSFIFYIYLLILIVARNKMFE